MAYERQIPVKLSKSDLATATSLSTFIPPLHELVVWSHVDTGSNTHIVNNEKFLHNYVTTPDATLGQVSGDRKAIDGKGDWHIRFRDKDFILQNVLCMKNNPTCTLSTGALKRSDGFTAAPHDTNHSLHLVDALDHCFKFTTANKLLRIINGLDYVPIKTVPPQESPTHLQSSMSLRRSNRISKPSRKV